jgi:hypothetical protein
MNKYLTKITSLAGLSENILKPILGVGKSILHDAGHSFHTAVGGGFKDAAVAKGIKNQAILRGISDEASLRKAVGGHTDSEIKDLQKNKKQAIVKSLGYGTGILYGAGKILDNNKEQQKQYYQ